MHKRAQTDQWGKWPILVAAIVLCLTIGTTPARADVNTAGNNFTILDSLGGLVGGTNDVEFTWDGTRKTSVECPQTPNATISSTCPFFGITWQAHDVAIYGPGTYTVYDGCPAACPSCGTGNAITFTVGAGELGAHMLFDWNVSTNIDVVNIWTNAAMFAPSPMAASGTGICGTNPADTVWDWMSTDWDGDSKNGYPMVEGPFINFNANFNLMGTQCDGVVCDDSDPCTTDSCDPASGCVYTPVSCPSGLPCNPVTFCDCGPPVACDDGNPCTDDSEYSLSCVCLYVPNTAPCDDGDACTEADTCSGGACAGTVKNCNDGNVCTDDSCDSLTGNCINANNTATCNDGDSCTDIDTCSNGACSGTYIPGCPLEPIIDTYHNNFTMLDTNNALVGGTNDVHFAWDGTEKTSVAVSGQVSNATLSSVTPFFGLSWMAHDVAIYGPGTYTVYTGCAARSPGCGSGTPITFTVGVTELGAHLLFDWGGNNDMDVVNIWKWNSVFEPSPMWTGEGGTGDPAQVWDWMSKDWDENGINGYGMVDGPFVNFSANFNVIAFGVGVCGDPPMPVRLSLVSPPDNARGLDTTVEFRWKKISDNDAVEYTLSYSTSADFESGTSVTIVSRPGTGMFFAGGAGLFIIGITFFVGTNRRSTVLLLGIVVLFAGLTLISCQNSHTADSRDLPIDEMSFTATGLSTGTTYYWKVAASSANSTCIYESDTHSFTTQ